MDEVCLICCSEDIHLERGIVPCNHNSVCGPCHARLRYLNSDLKCPVCKESNDRVIVDRDERDSAVSSRDDDESRHYKTYEEYGVWGDDELGQDYILREEVKMFFRKDYHENKIVPLFQLACQYKGCDFVSKKGMRALKDHMRKQHTISLCNLCVDNKRDFVSQLPRFRPEQLKKHMSKGDPKTSGFKGHPMCEFCKPQRFYDLTKLHEHLNKEHYKCHVCERQGLHNQFFKDYTKLQMHFDKQHFLCHHPSCLAARFVVFDNEIDLRAHERDVHGINTQSNGGTKINLEFRVRRTGFDGSGYEEQEVPSEDDFQFGLNGEAFVPESLPGQQQQQQENEPEISDPVHAARTAEMRAHAASIRNQQHDSSQGADAFPELGSNNPSGSSQPLVGWTGEGRKVVRNGGRNIMSVDAFPSLASATNAVPKRRVNGLTRNRAVATKKRTPAFSNIIGSAPVSAFASSAPARPQSQSLRNNNASKLTSDNFPSLGGSSSSNSTYTAANNFAKKLQISKNKNTSATTFLQRKTSNYPQLKKAAARPPTSNDFPSLGGSSTYAAAEAFSKQQMRQKAFGQNKLNGSAAQALANNVLIAPTPARKMDPKEQLASLKSILGPSNYKILKKFTVQFASNILAYEQYIDQCATCFPEGKKDADFWNFVPVLVESCPDEGDGRNIKALEYLATIRIAAEIEDGYMPQSAMMPSQVSRGATSSLSHRRLAVSQNTKPNASLVAPKYSNRQKSTWGSGSTVTKTSAVLGKSKLPPGTSVVKDALNEGVKRGTATKFMAKMNNDAKKVAQKKQQANHNSNSAAKVSKKSRAKKKKNELRDLAFG